MIDEMKIKVMAVIGGVEHAMTISQEPVGLTDLQKSLEVYKQLVLEEKSSELR
jgi:hypothetical protein